MPNRSGCDTPAGRHWLLTVSPENFAATGAAGYSIQGLKHKHGRKAEQIQAGDTFTFYITGEKCIGGIVQVTSPVFRETTRIWNSLTSREDLYEHRFSITPDLVPPAIRKMPVDLIASRLVFLRKWPAQHWHLGLQGQIREIPWEDFQTIRKALREYDG